MEINAHMQILAQIDLTKNDTSQRQFSIAIQLIFKINLT